MLLDCFTFFGTLGLSRVGRSLRLFRLFGCRGTRPIAKDDHWTIGRVGGAGGGGDSEVAISMSVASGSMDWLSKNKVSFSNFSTKGRYSSFSKSVSLCSAVSQVPTGSSVDGSQT